MLQFRTRVLYRPTSEAGFTCSGLQLLDRGAPQTVISWLAQNASHATLNFFDWETERIHVIPLTHAANFFIRTDKANHFVIDVNGQLHIAEMFGKEAEALAYPTRFAVSSPTHAVMTSKGLMIVVKSNELYLINNNQRLAVKEGNDDEAEPVRCSCGIVETPSADGMLEIVTVNSTGTKLVGWIIDPTTGVAHMNQTVDRFPPLKGWASCIRPCPIVSSDARSVVVGLATGAFDGAVVQEIGLVNGYPTKEWFVSGANRISDVAFVPDFNSTEGLLSLVLLTDKHGSRTENGGCLFSGPSEFMYDQLEPSIPIPSKLLSTQL
jgi:hypothetical protein